MDSFIGEIQAFPYQFAFGGFSQAWLPCLGQVVPIAQYSPLFSLIGTAYGGNGTTNFQLPNLNGTVTNSQGNGPGLLPRILGETLGSPNVNLSIQEMASHTHKLQMGSKAATGGAAGPGTAANVAAIDPNFNGFAPLPSTTTLAPTAMTMAGQGQPHDNNQPTLAIVWCICYAGVFPSFSS